MESYRLVLKKRIRNVSIFTILVVVIVLSMHFFFLKSVNGASGALFSFLEGFVIGLDAVALFFTVRAGKAMKDEAKLKAMYNEEHDERKAFIKQKAGIPVMTGAAIVLMIGGVVAGYFDSTVCYTMVACGMFIVLYQLALKLYYQTKF